MTFTAKPLTIKPACGKCDACRRDFPCTEQPAQGVLDVTSTATWCCFTCGRAFKSLLGLDNHVRRQSCQRSR